MWYQRLCKISNTTPSSYYSVGHDRANTQNTLLYVHDGNKLYYKKPERPTQSHLSAFPGIEEVAKGRIETNKNIGSFMYFPPDEISDANIINQEFRKIMSDLEQAFPNVIFYMGGEVVDRKTRFASVTKRIKHAQFGAGYGEWWIDESGATMYADIDIGDKGHEMYVVEHVQGEIVNYLKLQTWNEDFWNSALVSVAEDLLDEAHGNDARKKHIENYIGEKLENIKPNELIESDYVEDYMVGELRVNKQMMDIAMGRGDIRLYGVKNLGWKRVMNKFVDTWQLTSQDCVAIARGLSDIAQEDEEGTSLWTIEVRSTNKYYPNIPLSVIESGPMAISKYARGQN